MAVAGSKAYRATKVALLSHFDDGSACILLMPRTQTAVVGTTIARSGAGCLQPIVVCGFASSPFGVVAGTMPDQRSEVTVLGASLVKIDISPFDYSVCRNNLQANWTEACRFSQYPWH